MNGEEVCNVYFSDYFPLNHSCYKCCWITDLSVTNGKCAVLLFFSRRWHYRDSACLYMLFDYVCGGELFSYLRNAGRFSTSTGKINHNNSNDNNNNKHLLYITNVCFIHKCWLINQSLCVYYQSTLKLRTVWAWRCYSRLVLRTVEIWRVVIPSRHKWCW